MIPRSIHAPGAGPRLAMLQRWRSIAFEFDRSRYGEASAMVNTANAAVCIHVRLPGHVYTTRRIQR